LITVQIKLSKHNRKVTLMLQN